MTPRDIETRRGLFLDGSGSIGWALMGFGPDMPLIESDTFDVKEMADPEMFGPRVLIVRKWIAGMIVRHRPDVVGFERTYFPRHEEHRTNENTLTFLIMVNGEFMAAASAAGIECRRVNNSSAKKAMTGKGNAEKPAVREAARARWPALETGSQDACDAAAVGKYVIEEFWRRYGIAGGLDFGLFADSGRVARDLRVADDLGGLRTFDRERALSGKRRRVRAT